MRRLLPNIVTIVSLSVGMTAIRFAFLGLWQEAALFILGSAFLDGMDGRIARFLGSVSSFGAELDSLSDFLCFGVAPSLILYCFALQEWQEAGWIFSLFFAGCMALRLARFNVHRLLPDKVSWGRSFFLGVPAPAAAFLALLPLFAHLGGYSFGTHKVHVVAVMSALSGILSISRLPTLSIQNMSLSPKKMGFVLMGVVVMTGQALRTPWTVLLCLGCVYILSIPFSLFYVKRLSKKALNMCAPILYHEEHSPSSAPK
jgi:CDP-diacylglycerol--serine O-phosphatidyltransferase